MQLTQFLAYRYTVPSSVNSNLTISEKLKGSTVCDSLAFLDSAGSAEESTLLCHALASMAPILALYLAAFSPRASKTEAWYMLKNTLEKARDPKAIRSSPFL